MRLSQIRPVPFFFGRLTRVRNVSKPFRQVSMSTPLSFDSRATASANGMSFLRLSS
jgi:hypothetical protein